MMSTDDIERNVALIVLNARNLPQDARMRFVDAACADLRGAGMTEEIVSEVKRRVTDRLEERDAEPDHND